MTFTRLLASSLWYHRRANLAILLGVAVGTAVLTGALLVGDSLRGSLRERTLEQLAWVDQAMVAGRFFRQELANELGAKRASAAILLRGSVSLAPAPGAKVGEHQDRVNQVTILGVDPAFWPDGKSPFDTEKDGVVLNATVARELGISNVTKDNPVTVIVRFKRPNPVPSEAPLGQRDAGKNIEDLRLEVRAVLPDEGIGRFNLTPSAGFARNVFVPLPLLQKKIGREGRVNAVLVAGAAEPLAEKLRARVTLDDWGLVLTGPERRVRELFARLDKDGDGKLSRENKKEWESLPGSLASAFAEDGVIDRKRLEEWYLKNRPYLSLESREMLLDPVVVDAAMKAAKEGGFNAAPTLVYLANSISAGGQSIPYSVVAALDPTQPAPLGPFLPPGVTSLKDDEIVLADWKESPLKVKPRDTITLTFFEPEHHFDPKEKGGLRERSAEFTFRGFVPLGGAANDSDLTPEFPGITDKLTLSDWRPSFPYDGSRIKKPDERWWAEHRTTPKAYVTLHRGQQLWGSRFGSLTSIRVAIPPGDAVGSTREKFETALLRQLDPTRGGFVFDPVRQRGLKASSGFMDFGGLFLGFSFFLIAAALLLVGLLVRLSIDRRASELGLLLAMGYRRRTVRRLLLAEGTILSLAGGLLGLIGAVVYAWLMLGLLRMWWPGGLDGSFLQVHLTEGYGLSFILGYVIAVLVSLATIWWGVRILGKVAPRSLLHGETTTGTAGTKTTAWSLIVGLASLVGAVACMVGGAFVHDEEMRAGTFFGSGMLLLVAGIAFLRVWMLRPAPATVSNLTVPLLAVRNGARHPTRSLLTAGLLASATFLVVAVESFHRDPGQDFLNKTGGSGGFNLLAESDSPVFQDVNTPEGRDELNLPTKSGETMKDVTVRPFRLKTGDDASCLNLFQPGRPRLLGVPESVIREDGFRFAEVDTKLGHMDNPWNLLNTTFEDGAVPVFGEANTVAWMLKKGIGQDLEVPDESGRMVKLRFVGLLKDSVFQSELLMSEPNFLRLYPHQEGYQFFLIQAPGDRTKAVTDLLARAPQSLTVIPTTRRLEAYLGVENTYLATFQALGGLGLVLGALGLAVVLLRSVWERRGELALFRAMGFRNATLGRLVLVENVFLLLAGLGIGTVTALVAVAPHLLGGGGTVPVLRLMGLLAVVLAVALTSALVATTSTLHAPLLPALRKE